jgi:hypothetical protein
MFFMCTLKTEPNVVYRLHSIALDWIFDWNLGEAEKGLRVGSDEDCEWYCVHYGAKLMEDLQLWTSPAVLAHTSSRDKLVER